MAQAAEAAGFHGFGFTDHPAPVAPVARTPAATTPSTRSSRSATRPPSPSTLRLIPNIVVLPYRNPFVVAKAAATLDMLSGGRFTLAIGAGYLKGEFAALGVDHDERNELVDEALGVLRAIWTGDDVTVEGRHFSARGVTAHPRPVTEPHPPIWIGGNSGRARQRVADHGDGWCPFPAPAGLATTADTASLDTPERLAEAIDDLRRRLDAAGRDPATVDIAFSDPGRRRPGDRRLRRRRAPRRPRGARRPRRHLGAGRPPRRLGRARRRGRASATASRSSPQSP